MFDYIKMTLISSFTNVEKRTILRKIFIFLTFEKKLSVRPFLQHIYTVPKNNKAVLFHLAIITVYLSCLIQ